MSYTQSFIRQRAVILSQHLKIAHLETGLREQAPHAGTVSKPSSQARFPPAELFLCRQNWLTSARSNFRLPCSIVLELSQSGIVHRRLLQLGALNSELLYRL